MGNVVSWSVRAVVWFASISVATVVLCTGCTACTPPTLPDAARESFPPRPLAIDTSRIDPCTLLDVEQARLLGVERIDDSTVQSVDGTPSPGCTWLGVAPPGQSDRSPHVNVNAQLIQIPAEKAATPQSRVMQVNGYGSLVRPDRDTRSGGLICEVVVDAAPERSIRIQALLRSSGPQLSADELCRRATDAASMVMTTAVAITSH